MYRYKCECKECNLYNRIVIRNIRNTNISCIGCGNVMVYVPSDQFVVETKEPIFTKIEENE